MPWQCTTFVVDVAVGVYLFSDASGPHCYRPDFTVSISCNVCHPWRRYPAVTKGPQIAQTRGQKWHQNFSRKIATRKKPTDCRTRCSCFRAVLPYVYGETQILLDFFCHNNTLPEKYSVYFRFFLVHSTLDTEGSSSCSNVTRRRSVIRRRCRQTVMSFVTPVCKI
jgi:hypothetical protein